jgi:hypothetical protein
MKSLLYTVHVYTIVFAAADQAVLHCWIFLIFLVSNRLELYHNLHANLSGSPICTFDNKHLQFMKLSSDSFIIVIFTH